ncbi:MAG: outer membrane protein assembly factor BamE [Xylophilus ampelinus]
MPVISRRAARLALAAGSSALLLACGTVDTASNRIVSAITPYKIDIVQGNFVSKEQVAALQPGMSKLQVREILGTPLITSVFHADRWDYVFTIKRPNVQAEPRRLTVFFKDDALLRSEGDEMPSEAEFVASLDGGRRIDKSKLPVLEATPRQLEKFPAPARPAADAAAEPAPALPATYPPLESQAR